MALTWTGKVYYEWMKPEQITTARWQCEPLAYPNNILKDNFFCFFFVLQGKEIYIWYYYKRLFSCYKSNASKELGREFIQ